jgi:multidrug efflux system membrane fusion protein
MDRPTSPVQQAPIRSGAKPPALPVTDHGTHPVPEPAKRAAPQNGGHGAADPRYSYYQQPTGKSHPWVWVLVLLVIAGAAGYVGWKVFQKIHAQHEAAAGQNKPHDIPVVAEPVTRENLNQYLYEPGTVTPYATVTVRTRVDGQIMAIKFTEGQMVKQGDPLIEIDPRPFEVQLTQAKGQYSHDAALLKDAKLDLERYRSLLASAAIAQQQIDTQQALVEQYEGNLKTDQGQIDSAQLNIEYCHVTSPIGGQIGLRLVDLGNIVHATDTTGLAVIAQVQPITVVFTVPQDDIPRVFANPNRGQGLAVEAWTQDRSRKLDTGTLAATDSQVDITTETLKIKAAFENKQSTLFPSQGVEAKLLVNTLKNVVVVPHAAVQNGAEFVYAFVVKKDDKGDDTVDMRQITPGATEGDKTVVESGLNPGEMVITDNIDKLTQGMKVKVRPAAGKSAKGAATQSSTTRGSKPMGAAGGNGQHHHQKSSDADSGSSAPTSKEAAE